MLYRPSQVLLYIFTIKYWHVLDSNHDGALVFDENEDGIMVEDEFRKFGEWLETMLEITDNDPYVYLDADREAWLNAQVDDNDETASRIEIYRLFVGYWKINY